ncbi:hypothetical protein CCACVL1_22412 [Corchorus capsularis]|uniref:Uncharacterized protein n=1 Tax=Corchorus capsularis TaxID=210143 RepID=A0A1R3GZD6_COCAP|nr:hypothetical protein CCACVL1_22412 [Corchorus capsularis]
MELHNRVLLIDAGKLTALNRVEFYSNNMIYNVAIVGVPWREKWRRRRASAVTLGGEEIERCCEASTLPCEQLALVTWHGGWDLKCRGGWDLKCHGGATLAPLQEDATVEASTSPSLTHGNEHPIKA